MPRYWLNLGNWGESANFSRQGVARAQKVAGELISLPGVRYNAQTGSLVYKDIDLASVKEIKNRAQAVIKRHFPDQSELLDDLSITTQPECPRCGKFGRFSDTHCSDCGAKLTEKQYID